MKKYLLFALFLALFAKPGVSQDNCGLYISTNFDSECLLTEFERLKPLIDESICFHVCKGATVIYEAEGMPNAQFEWNVQGAETWNVITLNNDRISVEWPADGEVGNVICTATDNASGQVCTFNRCIEIIEKPIAGISSIPEADMTGDIPVLDVCLNQTVSFSDNSQFSSNTPLTGYFWEWENAPYSNATTESFDVTFDHQGEFVLNYRVVNECGCEDETRMVIRVEDRPSLELDCYGTACGDEQVTYRIMNTECSQYNWEIQGGTLVSFNYPELTIQWENPESGYGLIRLAGNYCEGICINNSYVKIPLLTNNVQIQGPETVCTAEHDIYELPLWGATEYTWNISGIQGVDYTIFGHQTPNELLVTFLNPGIYTINADYYNEVLPDCGDNNAEPITVEVKDKFEIEGAYNGCPGEAMEFTTVPQIDADWIIYDENDDQIYAETATSVLNYSFNDPGTYRITANNENYCKTEEFFVTIYEGPEPPDIANIEGPNVACPNSAELYSTSASDTAYYIGWESNYTTPASFDGEEFTANFGSIVGDVGAYQVDRITGCKSTTTWYPVDEFTPQNNTLNLPNQPVCANSVFQVSINEEDNILYDWAVSPATDASIVGDSFGPVNNIQVNNIDTGDLIIELNREYCDNQDTITGIVFVNELNEPILNLPDEVCENETLILDETLISNSSDIDLINGNFTWEVNGSTHYGLGAAVTINFTGSFTISLTYSANQCEPVTVVHNMYAIPAPNGNISPLFVGNDMGLTISIQDDDAGQFSYLWSTGAQTPSITGLDYGNYSCTVTNNSGCSSVFSKNLIETTPTDSVAGTIQINRTMENVCGHYEWSASGYIGTPVNWEIAPLSQTMTTSGADNQYMSADFNEPGLYQVQAKAPAGQNMVYMGIDNIAIPVVPDFDIILECDPNNENNLLLTLDDQTSYLENTTFTDDYWTIDNLVQSGPASVPSGGAFTVELIKEFTYTHPSTNEVFSGTCSASMQVNTDTRGQAAFSIEDDPNFCAGTPIIFNDLSTGDIIRWEWEFGDGASLLGQNAQRTYDDPSGQYPYEPSLTITDSYGCTSYAEQQIEVVANGLDRTLVRNEGPFCSGSAWELEYNWLSPPNNIDYTWMPEDLTTTSNTHDVYQTGNYHVLLEDDKGCRAQSNVVNLGFVNTPTAAIHGLTSYCPDENISLLGNVGEDFDYVWTITGPSSQTDQLFTPNIVYQPDEPGIWNVEVMVSNTQGSTVCSDMASLSVKQYPADPAPEIDWAGNACISNGPVQIGSNSGQVYWSNGDVSTTTEFINSGFISAHTINPVSGCESEYATFFIDPQPDFDGLLTGCYKLCKDWFPQELYTYITPGISEFDWIFEGHPLQHGVLSGDTLLDLPSNPLGFGDYFLDVVYGEECHAVSPYLTLEEKENCDDTCLITEAVLAKCNVNRCELSYEFIFNIENQCERPIIVEQITSDAANIVSSDLPITLDPGESSSVLVIFTPEEFIILDNIDFEITVNRNGSISYANVAFNEDLLTNANDCFSEECNAEISDIRLIDNEFSWVYYFEIQYETHAQPVEVTTDYGGFYQGNPTYDPASGIIEGFIAFDETFVNNHMTDTSLFCFEIYGCVKEMICITEACIPFAEFFNSQSKAYALSDGKDADNPLTNGGIDQLDLHVYPNPAKETIQLTGESCELVTQYCIYDISGDILRKSTSKKASIAGLKPGTYIIRADLSNGRVAFLKFIKQ